MLLETENIGSEVKTIVPNMIAVAFIGSDWQDFIDVSYLNKIILSPTLGSNPNAIESLVDIIGWDKVLFLDNLHAKIYIGENSAIVGSANLTKNGLSVNGLQEAALKTDNSQIIENLLSFFRKLELQAIEQYPSAEEKRRKLNKLKQQWNLAIRSSIFPEELNQPKLIQNYNVLGCDDFYIVWYQKGLDYEYSENVDSRKNYIVDEMHLSEEDKVQKGKWLLAWRITNNNKPYENLMPTWIFIDEIIENGVVTSEDYEYTKLALMLNKKTTILPPFQVTKELYKVFKEVVTDKTYAPYFIGNDEKPYLISNTFPVFEEFINKIKGKINS